MSQSFSNHLIRKLQIEQAQARTQQQNIRYFKEQYGLQQDSRAVVPAPVVEDDFPIKFNYKDKSCTEFHSLMEKERGESKHKVEFWYRVAKLLLLGLALQLIGEILKWLI